METRVLNNKKAGLLLLIALISSYAFICLTKNCFSSAMVFIVEEGLLTKVQTGFITSAFYLAYAFLQVIGGAVMDKWHPEKFITVGLVGAGLCNLVIFLNQNYAVMLAAWTVNAVVQFGVWPATFKLISTMLPEDMRTNSLFIITFSNPCGQVLSYVAAAIIGESWKVNFLFSAVGLFVIAAVWEVVFRSLKPAIEVTYSEGCLTSRLEKQKRDEHQNESFLKIAFRSGIIILCITAFIRCLFDLGIKSLTPTILNESYSELSPTLATALNIIVLLSGMLGTILAKLIYPKYIQNELKILAIFFGISLPLTISVYLMLGKVNYIIIVVLIAFIVMLMGGGTVFTTTYIAARYTKYGKGATIAGILNCVASLGVVAANTGFPAIAEQTGTWSATVAVWIALMSIALVLIIVGIPIWSKFIRNKR